VVVGHDDVHPGRAGRGHLGQGRDPAVDGDQQTHAGGGEPLYRDLREPVPVVEAARDLPGGVGSQCPQRPDEDGRGADAVHVVVAVDRDT
jgi:hypothetical protein